MSKLPNKLILNEQRLLTESLEPVVLSDEDILEYAKYLGINTLEEQNLLWIAAKGLISPLPFGWYPVEDVNGSIYYYNCKTNCSSWIHPADHDCKELLSKARRYSTSRHLSPSEHKSWSQGSKINHLKDSLEMSLSKNKTLSVSLSEKRTVRFDLDNKIEVSYESETGSDTDMEDLADKFGFMDAESLSPAFVRSPEPDDVNSLLRLSSSPGLTKAMNLSAGNSLGALPSMDVSNAEKRHSFLKPLSPIAKLPAQTISRNDILPKAKEKFRNIEVIADPLLSTMGNIESRSGSSSPLPPGKMTLSKLNSTAQPTGSFPPRSVVTITKTPPSNFSISEEELKLKVDHEMALIDMRNKYEDDREEEEEKMQKEVEELRVDLQRSLVEEKNKLQLDHINELTKIKESLESQKKEEIKKIEAENSSSIEKVLEKTQAQLSKEQSKELEDLQEKLDKKHKESLDKLKTKLESEHHKAIQLIEKDFVVKKSEQKSLQDKEMQDTKKKYTVDLAKTKLDLEKDFQKKVADMKKDNIAQIASLEVELVRSQGLAKKEVQTKLDDWKKNEEAKLIANELNVLKEQVSTTKKEFEEQKLEVGLLTKKKSNLEMELNNLESKLKILLAKTNKEQLSKSQIPILDPSYREQSIPKPNSSLQEQTVPQLNSSLQEQSIPKPKASFQEQTIPNPNASFQGQSTSIQKHDSFHEQGFSKNDHEYPGENLQILHQKVLHIDNYLQSFSQQLQSLTEIVQASPQLGFVTSAAKSRPNQRFLTENDFSSSESSESNVNMNDHKHEQLEESNPISTDEYSDLKELLKSCKNKLKALERKRFEVHGHEAFNTGRRFSPKTHSTFNNYWAQNMATRKSTIRKAQRVIGINTPKAKKKSQFYRYNHETVELKKMAEKLTKKLDKEAKELEKLELNFCKYTFKSTGNEENRPTSSTSSPTSNSSSQSETEIPKDDNYQPYIPYVPLTIQLQQHRLLPSHTSFSQKYMKSDSTENRVKQAWVECFGDKPAPVVKRSFESVSSTGRRTDHAKWMEKLHHMNTKIRQADSKRKDEQRSH